MWRYAAILMITVMMMSAARADDLPASATVFSLSAPRHTADGKITVPLRSAPPHFFPLAQKGKFFLLPRRTGLPAAASSLPYPPKPESAKATPTHASATPAASGEADSGMTREQAHQILSLFSSAR